MPRYVWINLFKQRDLFRSCMRWTNMLSKKSLFVRKQIRVVLAISCKLYFTSLTFFACPFLCRFAIITPYCMVFLYYFGILDLSLLNLIGQNLILLGKFMIVIHLTARLGKSSDISPLCILLHNRIVQVILHYNSLFSIYRCLWQTFCFPSCIHSGSLH